MPTPFATREFVTENQYREESDGSFTMIFEDAPATEDPPGRRRVTSTVTRASIRGIIIIVPLTSSTCHVTIVNTMNPGGTIPLWLVNRKASASLRWLPDLMKRYDRSAEVDALNAAAFIKYVHASNNNSNTDTSINSLHSSCDEREKTENNDQQHRQSISNANANAHANANADVTINAYTDIDATIDANANADAHATINTINSKVPFAHALASPSTIIAEQKKLLRDLTGWRTMGSSSRFQHMSIKHTDGDRIVTAKSVFRLSCSPAEALADYWLVMSNWRLKKHLEDNGNLPYEFIEDDDIHDFDEEDEQNEDERRGGRQKQRTQSSIEDFPSALQCQRFVVRQAFALLPPVQNREFLDRYEWEPAEINQTEEEKVIRGFYIGWEPADLNLSLSLPTLLSNSNPSSEQQQQQQQQKSKYGKKSDFVQGTSKGIIEMKEIAPQQTLVTFIINLDLKVCSLSLLSSSILNAIILTNSFISFFSFFFSG
jgi:Flp pilus assembly protein TadG